MISTEIPDEAIDWNTLPVPDAKTAIFTATPYRLAGKT
jgi:hypothetical protein